MLPQLSTNQLNDPYGSTVSIQPSIFFSAESTAILDDVTAIENKLTKSSFEYCISDKRRVLQKMSASALVNRLPSQLLQSRKSLSPRQIKSILEHCLRLKLRPTEVGALVDLFGTPERFVNSAELYIFCHELGSVGRIRRNAQCKQRHMSLSTSRQSKETDRTNIKKQHLIPVNTDTTSISTNNKTHLLPTNTVRPTLLIEDESQCPNLINKAKTRSTSTVKVSFSTESPSEHCVESISTAARRRSSVDAAHSFFGHAPSYWNVRSLTPNEIENEKLALRSALIKLCAAACIYDDLKSGPEGLVRQLKTESIPAPLLGRLLHEFFHVSLTKAESKAVAHRLTRSGDYAIVSTRALGEQFMNLARYGLRHPPESLGKTMKTKSVSSKEIASKRAINLMRLGQASIFSKDQAKIDEIALALRRTLEKTLKFRTGLQPFVQRKLSISRCCFVAFAWKNPKTDKACKALAMEIYARARNDFPTLAREWRVTNRSFSLRHLSIRRLSNSPIISSSTAASSTWGSAPDIKSTTSVQARRLLAAWPFLCDKRGTRDNYVNDQMADTALYWRSIATQARRVEMLDNLAPQVLVARFDTIAHYWNVLQKRCLPITFLASGAAGQRAATIYSIPSISKNEAGDRIAIWFSRTMRDYRCKRLEKKYRQVKFEIAAGIIQKITRQYLWKVGYNYTSKLQRLAALVIQVLWRYFQKRVLQRRVRRQAKEVHRLNAVLTMQRWWKRSSAREKIRQLCRIRQHLLEHSSAKTIQLRYRIMRANKILHQRQVRRAEQLVSGATLLQNLWRSRCTRERWLKGIRLHRGQRRIASVVRMNLVNRMSPVAIEPWVMARLRAHKALPCPLMVRVHSARITNPLTGGSLPATATPRVLVSSYISIDDEIAEDDDNTSAKELDHDRHPSALKRFPTSLEKSKKFRTQLMECDKTCCTSISKHLQRQVGIQMTQFATRNFNFESYEWHEDIIISGLEGDGSLVFTICDEPERSNSIERGFMGQTTLQLQRLEPGYEPIPVSTMRSSRISLPTLNRAKKHVEMQRRGPGLWWSLLAPKEAIIESLRLPLSSVRTEIEIERGRLIRLSNRDKTVSGEINVSVRLAPRSSSICGYLLRNVKLILTTSSWLPSWAVLVNGLLRLYNSRGDESHCNLEINVNHISAVDYNAQEDIISIVVGGSGIHRFRVPDSDLQSSLRRMWIRKLRRVSPSIPTNEFISEEISHQSYMKKSQQGQRPTTATRRKMQYRRPGVRVLDRRLL